MPKWPPPEVHKNSWIWMPNSDSQNVILNTILSVNDCVSGRELYKKCFTQLLFIKHMQREDTARLTGMFSLFGLYVSCKNRLHTDYTHTHTHNLFHGLRLLPVIQGVWTIVSLVTSKRHRRPRTPACRGQSAEKTGEGGGCGKAGWGCLLGNTAHLFEHSDGLLHQERAQKIYETCQQLQKDTKCPLRVRHGDKMATVDGRSHEDVF